MLNFLTWPSMISATIVCTIVGAIFGGLRSQKSIHHATRIFSARLFEAPVYGRFRGRSIAFLVFREARAIERKRLSIDRWKGYVVVARTRVEVSTAKY
jgi:hypothetical protein